jgi:hypothetical protein
MSRDATPTPILTIFLDDEHSRGFSGDGRATGQAHVYVEGWDSTRETLTSLFSYEYPYTRFTIEAYYGGDTASDTWAWEHGFRLEGRLLTAHAAASHHKHLQAIERKYEKLCQRMGAPQSFGQYVIYLAQCLGIKDFCWKSMHQAGGWVHRTVPEDARYHIDNGIMDFHEAHPRIAAA